MSIRRRWVLVALVFFYALFPAMPASAQTGESIKDFQSVTTIQPDGTLRVREKITYDFGSNERHGIFRYIPQRFETDSGRDRIYPIDEVSVTAQPAGTPSEFKTSTEGASFVIRIGDENKTITGTHTYDISYSLHNALNAFSDHDELFWNITGSGWQVPIEKSSAIVNVPTYVMNTTCFEGASGSNAPCAGSSVDGGAARFTAGTLQPGEQLTIVVSLPKGAVAEPTPVYARTVADGFSTAPGILAGAAALLAVLVFAVVSLYRRVGRDRRYSGSAVDQAFGSTTGKEEPLDWRGGGVVPVLFTPPEGVRPGLVGTLMDEKAQPLDVTATIIDLASRGFLEITEIPKTGWFGKTDWRLDKKEKDEGELLPYEQSLLNALFLGRGGSVELSDLKDHFASDLGNVKDKMYEEVVNRKWFAGNPETSRVLWMVLAAVLLAAAAGITYLLAQFTSLGMLGIPFVLSALLLFAVAPKMPRRTARGTAVFTQVRGFRRFMEEGEKHRSEFEERKNLFTEYLPYAVVFGVTEKWARAFEGLDGELPQPYWYHGSTMFTAASLNSSFNSFSSVASSTMASTPSSSGSSGFGGSAGGGGGGGGGGSW